MQEEMLSRIAELRELNYSYQFIADRLGLSMNTVKSICRRKQYTAVGERKTKAEKLNPAVCAYCSKPISLNNGKKFCSDYCRVMWWKKKRRIELDA